jgi:hypothetical protein
VRGLAHSVLVIPRAPERLILSIERTWDGAPCPLPHLHGRVEVAARDEGIELAASLPHQPEPRIPDAPRGARVADLWEYDVVECFLAGAGGRYLEVEFGAGGHFLVLSFSAPRVRSDAHEHLELPVDFTSDARGWQARVLLDWSLVPTPIEALNAYVSAGGVHLAYGPLPGPRPDFHAPSRFPRAALEHPPGFVRPRQ